MGGMFLPMVEAAYVLRFLAHELMVEARRVDAPLFGKECSIGDQRLFVMNPSRLLYRDARIDGIR